MTSLVAGLNFLAEVNALTLIQKEIHGSSITKTFSNDGLARNGKPCPAKAVNFQSVLMVMSWQLLNKRFGDGRKVNSSGIK